MLQAQSIAVFAGFLKDLLIQKRVGLASGVMVGRLGAVFAIFRAMAAASVDNAAKVYLISYKSFSNAICPAA
jgi:hypothetical protein